MKGGEREGGQGEIIREPGGRTDKRKKRREKKVKRSWKRGNTKDVLGMGWRGMRGKKLGDGVRRRGGKTNQGKR